MATDGITKLLSIKELSDLTGFSVSTLRRRANDGTLAKYQPGGHRTRMAFHPDALGCSSVTFDEGNETSRNSASIEDVTCKLSGPRPKWKALDSQP